MSLRFFHLLFISVSVLLCLGFGWWCWQVAQSMGWAFLCWTAAVGLAAYGFSFWRKIRGFPGLTAGFVFLAFVGRVTDVHSCATCYGNSGSSAVQGMNLAILFLLGVTACIWVSIGGFIFYLKRRASAFASLRG